MYKQRINAYFAVSLLVIAMLCIPHSVAANPVNDTFTDIIGQGEDPGNLILGEEHGGPDPAWAAMDADVSVVWSYNYGPDDHLRIEITNTSDHVMTGTVLSFEQNGWDWKNSTLAANSWDGLDGSNDAAFYFGNIASGTSSEVIIDVRNGETGFFAMGLAYNSFGLDSPEVAPDPNFSNVSIAHVVPEPVSTTLFLVGSATLGIRRFMRNKTVT